MRVMQDLPASNGRMPRLPRRGLMLGALAAVAAPNLGVALAAEGGAADPTDLVQAVRFQITMDGFQIASFKTLTTLQSESEPVFYLNDDGTIAEDASLKVPPLVKLKDGSGDPMLLEWHRLASSLEKPPMVFRSVSLVMYNQDGKPLSRYSLTRAWPAELVPASG